MFDLKKYRGVILHDTEGYAELEEKLICGLENDMRNMANFQQSTRKQQNWNLMGSFNPKQKTCELKIHRGA